MQSTLRYQSCENLGDLTSDQGKSRRLRGAFKNALVWGVAWGGLGSVVAAIIRLSDKTPLLHALLDGLGMGIRIGVVGAPWNLVTSDIVFSTVFGGITAAGTMLLAQRDEAKNPVTVQQLLDRMERESLGAGDAARSQTTRRSRSTRR